MGAQDAAPFGGLEPERESGKATDQKHGAAHSACRSGCLTDAVWDTLMTALILTAACVRHTLARRQPI